MDGEKVEIIMKTCKYSSHFVSAEVTACWCKFMRATMHHRGESVDIQVHSNGSHFCYCEAAVDHVGAPGLENLLEVGEVLWNLIGSDVFCHVSKVVEVSPFGVEGRRRRRQCLIVFGKGARNFSMIFCFFLIFRGDSNLKVILGIDVGDRSASIKFL